MLFQLYTVLPSNPCAGVHVTHDIEVDRGFWASSGRAGLELLATGLPLWAADRLAAEAAGGSPPPGHTPAGRLWRWRLRRNAVRWGGQPPGPATALPARGPGRLPGRDPVPDPLYLERLTTALAGRRLLLPELAYHLERAGEPGGRHLLHAVQLLVLQGAVTREPGVGWRSGRLRCLRCGGYEAIVRRPCTTCGRPDCPWCQECAALGPARGCVPLLEGKTPGPGWPASPTPTAPEPATGGGSGRAVLARVPHPLTPAQAEVAERLARLLRPGGRAGTEVLVWAACGAGKTEVLLPAVAEALDRGERVILAIPRRDVVLELGGRLAAGFPGLELTLLYGGAPRLSSRAGLSPLTVATTHQLLRLGPAFDLVILDEADAFPFLTTPMLHRALAAVGRPGARRVYLTATPDDVLQARAARGDLHLLRLPARHHGWPLPVPRWRRAEPLEAAGPSWRLSPAAEAAVSGAVAAGAPLFVFVPHRGWLRPVAEAAGQLAPGVATISASADHRTREAVRAAFRAGEIQVLVTTTVSERGLTVPRARVLVLWADAERIFRREVLIQIAGRSGRTAEDPRGEVTFVSRSGSQAMRAACREIEAMNREAAVRGLLQAGVAPGHGGA